MKSTKFIHIPSLDGVRGLAVLLVIFIHLSYGVLKGGWIGVDLFFALSGYLITSLLQREYMANGRIFLSNFYIRRILRLFPALFVCVALSVMLWLIIAPQFTFKIIYNAIATIFYVNNIAYIDSSLPLFDHLWSLAVEEHFYLFWPLIASLYVFKKSLKTQINILFIVVVIVSFFKIFLYHYGEIRFGDLVKINYYSFTLSRVDIILMGCMLSLIQFKHPVFFEKKYFHQYLYLIIFISFIIVLTLIIPRSNWEWNGGFLITNLICLSIIIYAIQNPLTPILNNKLLRYFGTRSYGLYVYHYPVYVFFEKYRQAGDLKNFLLLTIVRMVISILIAEVSFKLLETPILNLKKKFAGSEKLKPVIKLASYGEH